MNCTFQVGDKVVCVVPFDGSDCHGPILRGQIYTIRYVGVVQGEVGVLLSEINNPACIPVSGFSEHGYEAYRFRPVRTIKTDISVFQSIDRKVFDKQLTPAEL